MTQADRAILHPAELLIILLLTVTALEPTIIGGPQETGPPAPPETHESTVSSTSTLITSSTSEFEADLIASIGHIEECREIHLLWIRIMEANPERYANHTRYLGDVDYHREWVEKYDLVLKTLNAIKAQLEISRNQ